VQAERIGVQSNLSEADVAKLIDDNTDSPLVGLFGPTVTNVLEQNLALDAATK
jgi:K+-transporting ATPase ATPase C chain